jgi:tetratricopeptide (TPR) repeat protein
MISSAHLRRGGSRLRPPSGSVSRRATLLLCAAVLVAALSFLWPRPSAPTSPPTSAAVPGPDGFTDTALIGGAEAGIDGRLSLDGQVTFWSERVRREPSDYLSMTQLALAEAARARLTADLDALIRAEAQLARSVDLNARHGPTLRARAQVAFALHDFDAARDFAARALARDPRDAGALATMADARLELGDLDGAGGDYERLQALAAGPAIDARLARFRFLAGDSAGAIVLARRARDGALADPQIGDLAFYQAQLGELARLTGDAELARSSFAAALAARPSDLAALLGSARLEMFAGDLAAARRHLETAAAIAPQPATLALLGDLQQATGQEPAAAASFETVRFAARLGEAAGAVYDRELLLFDLDHGYAGPVSVDAARTSLAVRPDAAGHDLVAWSLHRTGDDAAARAEIDLALAAGSAHPRLRFHAGAIRLALGERDAGAALLRSALASGAGLDPIERTEAAALLAEAEAG